MNIFVFRKMNNISRMSLQMKCAILCSRLRLKCDGKRAETRFRLSAKRTSPFKSAGASVQSTTGSRGVRISGSNAGYTSMFQGKVKSTGYPLHSSGSPTLPLPCVTVCHHISARLYKSLFIIALTTFFCALQGRIQFTLLFVITSRSTLLCV
jgi:hypothetical protein